MDLGLTERVVIVTGSSRGIGKAAALSFGREGARVAVTFREHRAEAERVVEQIRLSGGDAMALPLDLAALETVRGAVAATIERLGRVDVLVNNAVQWGGRGPWEAPVFEAVPVAALPSTPPADIEGE